MIDVKDTGWQFDGLCLLPFLNIGVINADFHSCGMSPVLKDCLNKCVNIGVSLVASSLSTLAGMLSGPLALWGSVYHRSAKKSGSAIVIYSIDG